MGTPIPDGVGQLERTYVAYCLATQIVRIKRSAAKLQRVNEQARDMSPLLVQPLEAVAEMLGLTEAVEALVKVALIEPGAAPPPPVHAAPPLPTAAEMPSRRLGGNGAQWPNGSSRLD